MRSTHLSNHYGKSEILFVSTGILDLKVSQFVLNIEPCDLANR